MTISFHPAILAKTELLSERALYKRIRKQYFILRDLEKGKNHTGKDATLEHYAEQISLLFLDSKKKNTEMNYHRSHERLKELYAELIKRKKKDGDEKLHLQFHGTSYRFHLIAPKHELDQTEREYITEFYTLVKMETWLSHHVHDFCEMGRAHFDALYDISFHLLLLIYKTRIHILDIIRSVKSKKNTAIDKPKLYKVLKKQIDDYTEILETNWKSYKAQVDSKIWKYVFTPAKQEILNFRSKDAKLFFEKVHAKVSVKITTDLKRMKKQIEREEDPTKLEAMIKEFLAITKEKLEHLSESADSIRSYTIAIEKETHKVKHYASHVSIHPRHVEHIKASIAHLNTHVHKQFLSLEDIARRIMNYYQRELAKRIT